MNELIANEVEDLKERVAHWSKEYTQLKVRPRAAQLNYAKWLFENLSADALPNFGNLAKKLKADKQVKRGLCDIELSLRRAWRRLLRDKLT